MASLKRHRGKLVVDWEDDKGVRHRERVKDKEAGERRLAEILKTGKRAATTSTFKEYAVWWLENCAKGNIEDSTYEEYERSLRLHIYPEIGDQLFAKVSRPRIREIIAKKRKTHEPATIRNMLAPVRAMYNQAIEDGEPIALNPASRFGKGNKGKQKTVVNPYSKEEVSAFLQKALNLEPRFYPLFLTAVRTGLRRGELIALRPSDIDFERRLIHVQRTFSRGKIKLPKSGKTRLVDMSRQLTGVLRELPQTAGTLFTTTTGTMLEPSNLSKSFNSFLSDAQLRHIRFHDLRHTFATQHIKNNQSLAYIRDQLGHSSIKVTVDLYGHLVAGYNRSAADMLDDGNSGTADGTSGDDDSAK